MKASMQSLNLLLLIIILISGEAFHAGAEPNGRAQHVVEQNALLALKQALGGSNYLLNTTWVGNPCDFNSDWYGLSCVKNRVTSISLEGIGLSGRIDDPRVIANLTKLTLLSFKNNSISGVMMDFTNNTEITNIDLSMNLFAGTISNSSLGLNLLQSLQLNNNNFTGPLPPFNQSSLRSFNVSYNNLNGKIPNTTTLQSFNWTSFSFNQYLCGKPSFYSCESNVSQNNQEKEKARSIKPAFVVIFFILDVIAVVMLIKAVYVHFKKKMEDEEMKEAELMKREEEMKRVDVMKEAELMKREEEMKRVDVMKEAEAVKRAQVMKEGELVKRAEVMKREEEMKRAEVMKREKEMKRAEVMKEGELVKRAEVMKEAEAMNKVEKDEKRVDIDSEEKMVVVREEHKKVILLNGGGFDLDILLKASAEGLGKGSFGRCYKAMLDDEKAVVVKRLREVGPLTSQEFAKHVIKLAAFKHPNLLPLLGFYHSAGEKLLIYKFARKGSLFDRIHGGRGPYRVPFKWNARLSVAKGVARAMEYLHRDTNENLTVPHGNLKASNILLDENGTALVSDYGLALFVPTPIAVQRMLAYKSPEYQHHRKVSKKSDVWSYGCLLIELVTGKMPLYSAPDGEGVDLCKWVNRAVREEWTYEVFDVEIAVRRRPIKGMFSLLQVALKCCDDSPEMAEVLMEVEAIPCESDDDDEDNHFAKSIAEESTPEMEL